MLFSLVFYSNSLNKYKRLADHSAEQLSLSLNCIKVEDLKWSYEEFLCFLLIYVSNVDIEFSDEEKERIIRVFSEEVYVRIFKSFDSMSDYQALEEVFKYKEKYYNTPEKKQEILDNIKIQFFVDGDYSVMEKEVFYFLEKML